MFCHISSCYVSFTYLKFIEIIQRTICNVISFDLTFRIQPFNPRRNIFSLYLFYKYVHSYGYDVFSKLVFELPEFELSTWLAARSHNFNFEIANYNHKVYANSFFSGNSRLGKSLSTFCFSVSSDLRKL